ncbi:hypothetical protein [Pseudomonas sp. 8O]|uniref:hypothetical protein n=1 Tax=Pseudomonas sp. 8O TaxID=2653165 RepID=UPI0015B70B58|nr:hypothetical protein [Pseudomonas sp. 8O]
MSQTFTAATCCQRAHRYIAASPRQYGAACTGFVAILAHAQACCSADRLLIPVHD